MSTAPSAIEKAFRNEAEGGAVLGVDTDALQLDLLRDPNGKLPSNIFQLARKGQARRPGRPAGAGNKRNQKLAALICQQHGDPVLYMASVYAMPLDQLVELLRVADNSADREERLLQVVDETLAFLRIAKQSPAELGKSTLDKVFQLVDRLTDMASELKSKPGQLAISALATQVQAARATAEYVHGKQPVSVNVQGKADLVLLVPGLNAPSDMDHKDLQEAVRQGGLESLDFENMTFLPPPEDAEFEEPEE